MHFQRAAQKQQHVCFISWWKRHYLCAHAWCVCPSVNVRLIRGICVHQVVQVWISTPWWCSKVRMIKGFVCCVWVCMIHAQLWNLRFRCRVCVCVWSWCTAPMWLSVYIRWWTGGEVSNDAGAAVQKQRLPPLPSAKKKKKGQTEWRKRD